MEMSPQPEDALPAGDRLRDLVPDAGHLLHMPTHLDVLCGDYRQVVVSSNGAAITADERFVAAAGAMNFYTLYRAHNYHFKIYGAMFLGPAADGAGRPPTSCAAAIPESCCGSRVPPMADWLEGFVPMRMHVLIRFGRWQEIIDDAAARRPELYCVTTAMMHYAQGRGARGHREARRGADGAARAVPRPPPSACRSRGRSSTTPARTSCGSPRRCWTASSTTARATTRPRSPTCAGPIELDDGLPYDEPWGWMQPARHAYGALLLEQGRVTRGRGGLPGRPRPGRHPAPGLPASRQRLEPARLPRVPDPAGQARAGRHHRAAARDRRSPRATCRSPRPATAG